MAWTSVADFERDFDKATGCFADQPLGFQHVSHQHKGMNPQVKPLRHTLEQLQEMLVCAIVRKQLSAIDSTIEYVIPTVLHIDAQGTTH